MAYLGIDTAFYPGDDVMRGIVNQGNELAFVCMYMPSPSHKERSWIDKRPFLNSIGLGTCPIYVGQQVVGPGSKNVNAYQGKVDAADAIVTMRAMGYKPGSTLYLDLENGPPTPKNQLEYVLSWCQNITKGGYKPGVYCSFQLGATIHETVPSAEIWVFHVKTTKPANYDKFPDAPAPHESGYAGAVMWQFVDEARIITMPNNVKRLGVDFDSSVYPDPSDTTTRTTPWTPSAE